MVMEVIGFGAVLIVGIIAFCMGVGINIMTASFGNRLDPFGVILIAAGAAIVWWAAGNSPIHISIGPAS